MLCLGRRDWFLWRRVPNKQLPTFQDVCSLFRLCREISQLVTRTYRRHDAHVCQPWRALFGNRSTWAPTIPRWCPRYLRVGWWHVFIEHLTHGHASWSCLSFLLEKLVCMDLGQQQLFNSRKVNPKEGGKLCQKVWLCLIVRTKTILLDSLWTPWQSPKPNTCKQQPPATDYLSKCWFLPVKPPHQDSAWNWDDRNLYTLQKYVLLVGGQAWKGSHRWCAHSASQNATRTDETHVAQPVKQLGSYTLSFASRAALVSENLLEVMLTKWLQAEPAHLQLLGLRHLHVLRHWRRVHTSLRVAEISCPMHDSTYSCAWERGAPTNEPQLFRDPEFGQHMLEAWCLDLANQQCLHNIFDRATNLLGPCREDLESETRPIFLVKPAAATSYPISGPLAMGQRFI